ncbi:hypothetical protein JRQ81_001143 [Phrynocephalus forsythii]|uniref:Uncharacterized protein n=1 Tax=Phrynocephalus forsythii TaxID=171643 RepID=A0A9Q0YB66_9SAUR|nr:hypothetical protein JRQ81_001143 [Phrynocephalus forsythii]
MTSMEPKKKRRRRRKVSKEKPMEVGSNEFLENAREMPADIEQLAHKYMQKCTVESSTESESDANPEVLSSSVLSEGFLEKASYAELHFLDPYDGDYEELSGESDWSLGSLDSSSSRAIFLKHPIMESWTTEDSLPPEDLDSCSTALFRDVSVTVAEEEGGAGLHKTTKTSKTSPLTTESSWCPRPPSKHSGICESAPSESALLPKLMDCDHHLYGKPSTTRKQGRSVLECTGEIIRKRLRVA